MAADAQRTFSDSSLKTRASGLKITQALTGGTTTRPDPTKEDARLTLNVGGVRHDTWKSTLESLPGTRLALLAHLQQSDESYDPSTREYFFDRHSKAFESVLNYYRTQELHLDQSLCGNILKMELDYWGIEEQEIEACCWADYSRYTEHKDTLRNLDDNFAFCEEDTWGSSPNKFEQAAARIWRFLEEPASSRWAKIYAVTSMSFVALSIAIFVLETHKLFQVEETSGIAMSVLLPDDDFTATGSKVHCCCGSNYVSAAKNATANNYVAVPHPALVCLDYVCVVFFTIEFLIRFIFCPSRSRFFRAPLNLIDLICLIPHYTSIIMRSLSTNSQTSALIKTILMLRIVRILRIFKLMKHYNAFKILVYTIKVSTKELFLMIVFLMSGVLMFASIIHYTEKENFPNIPIGIWWALVTMTTVGYGDKYPVGYIGYLMGSVCVICGVLVIAFTVPIVVNNFSLYYSHAQTRINVPSKRNRNVRKLREAAKLERTAAMKKLRKIESVSSTVHMQSVKSMDYKTKKNVLVNNLNFDPNDTPRDDGRMTSSRATFSSHGDVTQRTLMTPLESPTELEDIESLDSGFSGEQQKQKKIEEESQMLIDNLIQADKRLETERKRQEWLIQQKRGQRARLKNLPQGDMQDSSDADTPRTTRKH